MIVLMLACSMNRNVYDIRARNGFFGTDFLWVYDGTKSQNGYEYPEVVGITAIYKKNEVSTPTIWGRE